MHNVSQAKLDLIRKIVNAKLTKEEMQAVTNKAQEIINRRPCSPSEGSNGEKVLHDIPIYDQTDTDGIIKEALSIQ